MKSKCFQCCPPIAQICLFAVLAIMCVDGPLSAAADPASFAGGWISRSIEGAASPNNDPTCQVIAWTDRKISLEQIPGNPTKFRGEWVRSYQADRKSTR